MVELNQTAWIERAAQVRDIAIFAHGNQKYGDLPYVHHLDAVAKLAVKYAAVSQAIAEIDFLGEEPIDQHNVYKVVAHLRMIAFLHDAFEDTDLDVQLARQVAGNDVVDIALKLTDPPGANRKERKAKAYPRIRSHQLAVYIKLCDRLANTQSGGKISMYQKEFGEFWIALYRKGEFDQLWKDLRDATFAV